VELGASPPEGHDNNGDSGSKKKHKTGRRTRKKVKKAIRSFAMPMVQQMVGSPSDQLIFTGVSATKPSFLLRAAEKGSIYQKREIDVRSGIEELETLGMASSYIMHEGLPGLAWSRGIKGETDWHVIEDLHNDPETCFNQRLAATVPLFQASIGVPMFDISNPKRLVSILLLYMPHEEGSQGTEYAYLDSKENSKLDGYLGQVATTLAWAIQWNARVKAWKHARTFFNMKTSERSQQLWNKLRIAVRTGFLTRSMARPVVMSATFETKWQGRWRRLRTWAFTSFTEYVRKFKGQGQKKPPGSSWSESVFSSVTAFLGLLVVSSLHYTFEDDGFIFLLGSFGAVATIVFSIPFVTYAQPRNIVVSHVVAGVTALVLDYAIDERYGVMAIPQWVADALIPAIIIFIISYLGFIHPPAAACGLIYIRGGEDIKNVGWMYLVMPSLIGCVILIAMGVMCNNLRGDRRYPLYW